MYSCVYATASDKFMHSSKNVKLTLAKELGRGVQREREGVGVVLIQLGGRNGGNSYTFDVSSIYVVEDT